MSDTDSSFLLEEVSLREDNCEYDVAEANKVLQQERDNQRWKTIHEQGESSENEDDQFSTNFMKFGYFCVF